MNIFATAHFETQLRDGGTECTTVRAVYGGEIYIVRSVHLGGMYSYRAASDDHYFYAGFCQTRARFGRDFRE